MLNFRQPSRAPETESAGSSTAQSDMVTLPLGKLVMGLPDALKGFIAKPPPTDASVSFPVSRIMPQLAKGAIKVTYGELAAAAPEGIFISSPNQADTPVALPLKDVLPQLSSAMKRKSAKKVASVPPQDFFGASTPAATSTPSNVANPAPTPPPTFSPQPVSPPTPAAKVPHTPAPPATEPPAGQAAFPLAKILAGLPEECGGLVVQPPSADTRVNLPVDQLAPQLPKGRVTITLAELAAACPAGTFGDLGGHGGTAVKIPLGDVLAQIGPGVLKRRQPTKKLEGIDKQDFFGGGKAPASEPTTASPTPQPAAPPPTFSPAQVGATTFHPTPPEFAPSAPSAPSEPLPSPAPQAPTGQAAFQLVKILDALSSELRALVATEPPPDTTINIAADRLAPQLAKGRVAITLKELAEAAPVGTFANVAGHENQPVSLPLGDVLAQIGPGALKRREPVRKLQGLEKQDFFGGGSTQTSISPAETAEPPGSTTFAPRPGPPAESASGYTTFEPKPIPSPASTGGSTVFVPAESAPPLPENNTDTSFTGDTIVAIPVSKLADRWTSQMKTELARLPDNTVIEFPAEALGHALKTGRVHFTWPQLRNWSRPRTSFSSPALDGAGTLDIPLRAVVGPFMAAMRGKPGTATAPPSASEPPAATPPTAPEPGPAPSTPPAPSAPLPPSLGGISMTGHRPDETGTNVFVPPLAAVSQGEISAEGATLGDLLGIPGKDNWTPVEIVQRVAGLPAVAGAMLSLAEGQVAAADLPGGQPTPAIARRVPHLYQTVGDEIRQMELDPPSFISFTAAGTPWLVFKLGNIFFTVQGRPGEHLPVSRLEAIAVQVGKQCR